MGLGLNSWIGSGWCSGNGPWTVDESGELVRNAGQGVNRQLPHLGDAGQGGDASSPSGTQAKASTASVLPRDEGLFAYFAELADRLRGVRVCCGDWSRVTGPSVTHRHGMTGVFLDPPYADTAGRTADIYATDSLDVAHDVRRWAIEEGRNPLMRICLAGYEGEHDMPEDWTVVEWKAQGGFGNQSDTDDGGRANAHKERLWFSPACIKVEKAQRSLFDLLEA